MLSNILVFLFIILPLVSCILYVGYRMGRTAQRQAAKDCLKKLQEKKEAIDALQKSNDDAHAARLALLEKDVENSLNQKKEVQGSTAILQKEIQLSIQSLGHAGDAIIKGIRQEIRSGEAVLKNLRTTLETFEDTAQKSVSALQASNEARAKVIESDEVVASTEAALAEVSADTAAVYADTTGEQHA